MEKLSASKQDIVAARPAAALISAMWLLSSTLLPLAQVGGVSFLQSASAAPSAPIHGVKESATLTHSTSSTIETSSSTSAEKKSEKSEPAAAHAAAAGTGNSQDAESPNVPASLADATHFDGKTEPSKKLLQGKVESGDRNSPFIEGSVQTIPKGTKVEFTLTSYINSSVTHKGDEVYMRISGNVPGQEGVSIPGGWYAHGYVTEAKSAQNMHRNGYVEVEFDKLVSPDGHSECDFPAKLSTKDSAITSTLKEVAFGTKCTSVGALGGAICSVQLTGIGGAIATHGISVGVGAGVGAALGIIGALKRQGNDESLYGGDDIKLTISEPIMLPAFKQNMIPSAQKAPKLKDMIISVNKIRFAKDPSGDSQSRLLDVDMTVDNHTKRSYSPRQFIVLDDKGHEFTPWIGEDLKRLMQKIGPEQSERIDVLYEVNSGKHKYWLSLREPSTGAELSRVPINID
ncbi:MAG TPA: hypothetical protein V6C86_16215 [Oculatellaceae cyanobacterium]